MIDTDKYEGHTPAPWVVIDGELYHRDNNEDFHLTLHDKAVAQLIADAPLLLAEVKRLREENETLRKMDWEYECLWTWLAENTNLLNTIEPLMEEWKKEYDEE